MKNDFKVFGKILLSILLVVSLFKCGSGGDDSDIGQLRTEILVTDWLIVPHDLAFDANGNLLVACNLDNRIALLSPDGDILMYYELESYEGSFQNTCVATTSSGDSYALNSIGLYKLNANGTVTKLAHMTHHVTHMVAGEGESLFFTGSCNGYNHEDAFYRINLFPTAGIQRIFCFDYADIRDLDRGPDNNFYAFSAYTGTIMKFSVYGSIQVFKSGFSHHVGHRYLSFTPDGTMFLADQAVYEIDLDGNVTVREEFQPHGEMLFLPDKSYYTLDQYSSNLMKYDEQGNLTALRSGQIGRTLTYLPSGAFGGRVCNVGHYEYFPSGKLKTSTFDYGINYVFDKAGNSYYFTDVSLNRVDPLGTSSIITEDVSCDIDYYDEIIAFSEVDQVIYATCSIDQNNRVMRYFLNGDQYNSG